MKTFLTALRTKIRLAIVPLDAILASIPERGTLLDVGCGAGALSLEIAKHRPHVQITGVDINVPALEKARAAAMRSPANPSGGSIAFYSLSALESELKNQSFDTVLLVDVLHHVPRKDQKAFLTMCAARVRPGGRLVYKDIDPRPWWSHLSNLTHDLIFSRQWVCHIAPERTAEWMSEAGWAQESSLFQRILWYGQQLLVFRSQAGRA